MLGWARDHYLLKLCIVHCCWFGRGEFEIISCSSRSNYCVSRVTTISISSTIFDASIKWNVCLSLIASYYALQRPMDLIIAWYIQWNHHSKTCRSVPQCRFTLNIVVPLPASTIGVWWWRCLPEPQLLVQYYKPLFLIVEKLAKNRKQRSYYSLGFYEIIKSDNWLQIMYGSSNWWLAKPGK